MGSKTFACRTLGFSFEGADVSAGRKDFALGPQHQRPYRKPLEFPYGGAKLVQQLPTE